MSTINVSLEGMEFSFRAEENISDSFTIEQNAESLAGGSLRLNDLKAVETMSYDRYLNYCREKFGTEEHKRKVERIRELTKKDGFASDPEYRELFDQLNNNQYFLSYFNVATQLKNIYAYARLKTLCVRKPDNFSFFQTNEQFLQKLLNLLEEQKVFFRR